MHTAIHNFVAQGFLRTLGDLIINEGVGSHFGAAVTACPVLRLFKQLFAYSKMTLILGNVPTLDVA